MQVTDVVFVFDSNSFELFLKLVNHNCCCLTIFDYYYFAHVSGLSFFDVGYFHYSNIFFLSFLYEISHLLFLLFCLKISFFLYLLALSAYFVAYFIKLFFRSAFFIFKAISVFFCYFVLMLVDVNIFLEYLEPIKLKTIYELDDVEFRKFVVSSVISLQVFLVHHSILLVYVSVVIRYILRFILFSFFSIFYIVIAVLKRFFIFRLFNVILSINIILLKI